MTAPIARSINAVVVSAGLMQKTVKVRIGTKKWHSHIGKVIHHPSPVVRRRAGLCASREIGAMADDV
jgi:ribosomal protein S17